ncbi:MAG: hypothetical protein ACRDMV_04055 [Streptosporangiales bacterium]
MPSGGESYGTAATCSAAECACSSRTNSTVVPAGGFDQLDVHALGGLGERAPYDGQAGFHLTVAGRRAGHRVQDDR